MNEREYLQKLSRSTPDEITDEILHADEQQARVLQIYFGTDQFAYLQNLARQQLVRGGDQAPKKGNVVVLRLAGGVLADRTHYLLPDRFRPERSAGQFLPHPLHPEHRPGRGLRVGHAVRACQ